MFKAVGCNYSTDCLFLLMLKQNKMPKLKYQRLEVAYPSGTTAGEKTDHDITLDIQMDRVVAVAMYPIADGGVDPVRVGLKDPSGEIQEPTHQDDWIDKGSGDYYGRKKPMDFEARGRKVKLTVDIPAELTAELKFDFVFMMKND